MAARRGWFCWRAKATTFSTVESPIPRAGVLTMRNSAISSSGFCSRRRYAIRSLISARS
jgi:hypothetical protein